jgi:hypothetical protein
VRRSEGDLTLSVGGEVVHRATGAGGYGRVLVHAHAPKFKVAGFSVTGERHGAPIRWASPP